MSVPLKQPTQWAPPDSEPLNEALWQAWKAKGRARERRNQARWREAVKLASIVCLVVTAGAWSAVASFEVVVRSIVTLGAILVMAQSVRSRSYAVAGMLAVVALVYNPVAPVFGFAGDWQRAVVLASTIPFVASLYRRSDGTASRV